MNAILFDKPRIYWTIFMTWLISLGFSFYLEFNGCKKGYNILELRLEYECLNDLRSEYKAMQKEIIIR
uniref:ATP synthase F0 subunit 8 n=1 Tax=Acrobeloides nanus TaxID=290746 RepID=A0A914EQB1_9BILA